MRHFRLDRRAVLQNDRPKDEPVGGAFREIVSHR
jgi:hypothetical protein